MSTFSFTIPAADVDAIKNTSGSSAIEITVDRGFSRSVSQDVLVAKFGDGYEPRVLSGLNPKKETLSAAFNNRSAADIALISAYLDRQAGLKFNMTVTDAFGTGSDAGKLVTSTIKVTCSEYSISYPQPDIHSLTATFDRVYEP